MTIDLEIARKYSTAGLYRICPFKATGPSSYATGGHVAGSKQFGMEVEVVPDLILQNGSATRLAVYSYSAGKYVIYVPDTGAEVANGTDLSGYSARGVVFGR